MNRRHAALDLPADVFARIVAAVPMKAAAERYGLAPDQHGWCRCPFHGEKTPSFKIYPDRGGFYCFGCGAGGDVLTFTERLLHLSPIAAARRLDADFSLGFFDGSAQADSDDWRRHKAERDAAVAAREARKWAVAKRLKIIHDLPMPTSGDDDYAAWYALQKANEEYLEELKETL